MVMLIERIQTIDLSKKKKKKTDNEQSGNERKF